MESVNFQFLILIPILTIYFFVFALISFGEWAFLRNVRWFPKEKGLGFAIISAAAMAICWGVSIVLTAVLKPSGEFDSSDEFDRLAFMALTLVFGWFSILMAKSIGCVICRIDNDIFPKYYLYSFSLGVALIVPSYFLILYLFAISIRN